MTDEHFVTAPGASDLAGIVFDDTRQKLYVVDRGTKNLFVYSWDAQREELSPDGTNPKTLTGLGSWGAHGVALDTANGLLYVSDFTAAVHYYDTDDWAHIGSVNVGEAAVDIDIDSQGRYLYAGGYRYHQSLVKVDLTSGIAQSYEAQADVIGLAVDPDSGLVYATTSENDIRVYDASSYPFALTDYENIGAGTGVCVPVGDVSYKPDVFILGKDDGVVDCVSPSDQFTYTISYNANGYADTGVVITDCLPIEVDYLSCTGGGVYDSGTHRVIWELGDISPSAWGTLEILVEVNNFARAGVTITNQVEMEGDTYYSKRTEDTSICCWYAGEVIYVDEDAAGFENGTSWDDAYTDLQDALAHVTRCPGAVAEIWVAAGTYKPTASPSENDATFKLIDGVDMYGHFGGIGTYETSIEERDFDNPEHDTRLDGQIGPSVGQAVKYVVTARNITELVFDGFTVTGAYTGAGILIEDCPNAELKIVRCEVKDNAQHGIVSTGGQGSVSYFLLQGCLIAGNEVCGLRSERSWPVVCGTVFAGQNESQCGISAHQSVVDINCSDFEDHTGKAIYASDSDLLVDECSLENNGGTGIECSNSWLTLSRCLIQENGGAGIGSLDFSDLEVTGSKIRGNGYDGIYLENSLQARITNNWICGNHGYEPYTCAGIYLLGAIDQAHIRNNTICSNNTYGIYLESGTEPEVVNCIVYGNTTQVGTVGSPLGTVSYSCIEGGYSGTGNISDDPLFLAADIGDYHLTWDSPCVDAGMLDSAEQGERDIDGNPRVMGGRVDMGADEDFPHCDRLLYDDWVLLGRPDCWLTPYQCDGDAACDIENEFLKYRVYINDLNLVTANWKKRAGDPTLDPCADIDHKYENEFLKYRVFINDLNIVVANWKKTDADLPGDCAERSCNQQARQGTGPAAVVSSTSEMLDWLTRLWLEPDAKQSIDAENWLRVYQSLQAQEARR